MIEPALARHRGRLVKLMGDGLLAEFASVVDAAACAVAIQDAAAPARRQPRRRLRLRIGLNLGDVVVEGDDLMGDGVNVAARLEGLAEPGGIVVSGTAYDHLHGKLGLGFASLGDSEGGGQARRRGVRRVDDGERGGLDRRVAPEVRADQRAVERPAVLGVGGRVDADEGPAAVTHPSNAVCWVGSRMSPVVQRNTMTAYCARFAGFITVASFESWTTNPFAAPRVWMSARPLTICERVHEARGFPENQHLEGLAALSPCDSALPPGQKNENEQEETAAPGAGVIGCSWQPPASP